MEGRPLVVPACDSALHGHSRIPMGMELKPWKNQLELAKFHILDKNDWVFFILNTTC